MIVLGDISGIQRYVFDVPEAGGGQARRLRARSFLVQALAECAALRVIEAMGWASDRQQYPFSAAGKFLLRGAGDATRIPTLMREMNAELLDRAGGELRLSLAAGDGATEVAAYASAQRELQRVKSAPWRPETEWDPAALVLGDLGTPCDLCRREAFVAMERDEETKEEYRVCRTCQTTHQLGKDLPDARYAAFTKGESKHGWLGYGVELAGREPSSGVYSKPIRADIPRDPAGKPKWFLDLAQEATGDKLLAVLKADVDGLGAFIGGLLEGRETLEAYLAFAERLDGFFSGQLQTMIERRPIYSVFAGGDDLVMIGPWDEMFRFAGEMRKAFREAFKEFPGLGLSAGLAIFKPKRPVKTAVAQAETLLEQAKAQPGKDRCAAFGGVWAWDRHATILDVARRLIEWESANLVQRGWLHTLLELHETRHPPANDGLEAAIQSAGEPWKSELVKRRRQPDPMATARLAYHVSRNWRNPAARTWADGVVRAFDDPHDPTIQNLPAVLRYTLTATRNPGERD